MTESESQKIPTGAAKDTASPEGSRMSRKFITGKLIPWMMKGGLAVLDYGLISGSNFLLGILLGRWLSPDHYGSYALAFSIFILVGFLYQALLLEPLSVFAGSAYRNNIRGYLKATLTIHWAISAVVCVIVGGTAFVAWTFGHSPALAAAFAGLTVATPFILIHGMTRRSFYLKLSPGPAAFGAFFYFLLVTGGVAFVYWRGWLSAFTAFLVMGLAALVSALVMLYQLSSALEPATAHVPLQEVWSRHWDYGRWALGTCVVGWIPNYVYIPVVSSFSGMAAAGELRALMNLAAPVLQTFAALSMLFLPMAARMQSEGGKAAVTRLTQRLTVLFVGGAIAYWAVIIPVRQPLFHFLYGGKYMESTYLLPLFALETIVWSASMGPAILLRAMESPRSLFVANCAASVLAVVVGIPATRLFGLQGVVWSMILANGIYVAVAFFLLTRKTATLTVPSLAVVEPMLAD